MKKFKSLLKTLIPPIILIIIEKLRKIYSNEKEKEFSFNYVSNFYIRLAFVNKAISLYYDCKYLEIGVCTNEVFNSVPLSVANKIGVDPVRGGTHRMTSDQFFIENNKKFSVIFIDGLHEYTQCQKDCINALDSLEDDGIIIFHDFLPRNELEENVPPRQRTWSGDVWKVAVEINNSKNMDFVIVNIDRGIGLLKIKKGFEYIKNNELKNKDFNHFINDYYKKLPIVSSEDGLKFLSK